MQKLQQNLQFFFYIKSFKAQFVIVTSGFLATAARAAQSPIQQSAPALKSVVVVPRRTRSTDHEASKFPSLSLYIQYGRELGRELIAKSQLPSQFGPINPLSQAPAQRCRGQAESPGARPAGQKAAVDTGMHRKQRTTSIGSTFTVTESLSKNSTCRPCCHPPRSPPIR
jgi:hypothetical protein